jgi:hypothetical protein
MSDRTRCGYVAANGTAVPASCVEDGDSSRPDGLEHREGSVGECFCRVKRTSASRTAGQSCAITHVHGSVATPAPNARSARRPPAATRVQNAHAPERQLCVRPRSPGAATCTASEAPAASEEARVLSPARPAERSTAPRPPTCIRDSATSRTVGGAIAPGATVSRAATCLRAWRADRHSWRAQARRRVSP